MKPGIIVVGVIVAVLVLALIAGRRKNKQIEDILSGKRAPTKEEVELLTDEGRRKLRDRNPASIYSLRDPRTDDRDGRRRR